MVWSKENYCPANCKPTTVIRPFLEETAEIKTAVVTAANNLVAQEPNAPLFHPRYNQAINPCTGIGVVDRFFENGQPPLGTVIVVYEPSFRLYESDHILANLLIGYVETKDNNDDSAYHFNPTVPVEKAVYFTHSSGTDLLKHVNKDNLLSFKHDYDSQTGMVDYDSLLQGLHQLSQKRLVLHLNQNYFITFKIYNLHLN